MKKTIFLNRFDAGPRATRVLLFLVGATQLGQGISRLDGSTDSWSLALSFTQILAVLRSWV